MTQAVEPRPSWPKQHPLATYFILAYAISWAFWLPLAASSHGLIPVRLPGTVFYSLAALGPLLAALLASGLEGGRPAVRTLLSGLTKWRVGLRWYLAALLGYPALLLVALALDLLLGGAPSWPIDDLRGIHMPFWFLLVINAPFVLCEEIGWRGYALPRLQAAGNTPQRTRSALWATLVLWVLWATWHVPSFLMRDSLHHDTSFTLWTVWLLQMAILLTWLYNGSGGSVLLAWLYHAAMNYAGFVVPLGDRGRIFAGVLLLVATVLIVTLSGPRRLGRRKASD
jgi:membrane protease YdiL (CAAX protease family)